MTALLMDIIHDYTPRLDEELTRQEAEKLTRKVLRRIVGDTDTLAGIALRAWKWVRETLEGEGLEGRELTRYCQVLQEGIKGFLGGYERLLKQAEASGLTAEAVGLRELEAKLPALREALAAVGQALSRAAQPSRPIDEKALAASAASLERGEFVTLDDQYLARLRAGEDF